MPWMIAFLLVSYLLAQMMGRSSVVFLSPDVGPRLYSYLMMLECFLGSILVDYFPIGAMILYSWLSPDSINVVRHIHFLSSRTSYVGLFLNSIAPPGWGDDSSVLSHAVRLLSLVMFTKFWLSSCRHARFNIFCKIHVQLKPILSSKSSWLRSWVVPRFYCLAGMRLKIRFSCQSTSTNPFQFLLMTLVHLKTRLDARTLFQTMLILIYLDDRLTR